MSKIRITRALIAGTLISQTAFAGTVNEDVGTQLKRLKGTKSAFCFAVEKGAVTGVNENTPVRAASITKTVTTFWALKRHEPDFRYKTRIYVQASNKEVHIAGSLDPFFDRDRMFALLTDLNKKGIKEISRLTYDSKFWFWPDATDWRYLSAVKGRHMKFSPKENYMVSEDHTKKTIAGDPEKIKGNLEIMLNTAKWPTKTQSRYQTVRRANPSVALPPALPKMKTDVVDLVPSNPLEGKPGVVVFEVKSAPLKLYLKEMNIHSINPYAEELFFSLGGRTQFLADMATYGYGEQMKGVYSGSGVNLNNSGERFDTTFSCSSVVRMIRSVDEQLEAKGGDLTDVMMAPAIDGGTAGWIDGSKAFVVKTGTLKRPVPVKNLAGVEKTTEGEVYFGIFLDGRNGNSGSARRAQTAMMTHFRPLAVKSAPVSFSPLGAWTHLEPVTQPEAAPVVAAAPTPVQTPAPNDGEEIVVTAPRRPKPQAAPSLDAKTPPVLKVDTNALL